MNHPSQLISNEKFQALAKAGALFTFDNPESPLAKWSKCDIALWSYMGFKVFLADGRVGMLYKIKGYREAV